MTHCFSQLKFEKIRSFGCMKSVWTETLNNFQKITDHQRPLNWRKRDLGLPGSAYILSLLSLQLSPNSAYFSYGTTIARIGLKSRNLFSFQVSSFRLFRIHYSPMVVFCILLENTGPSSIFADQLTLSRPGGTDYAHNFTTSTPGFSRLPMALIYTTYLQFLTLGTIGCWPVGSALYSEL